MSKHKLYILRWNPTFGMKKNILLWIMTLSVLIGCSDTTFTQVKNVLKGSGSAEELVTLLQTNDLNKIFGTAKQMQELLTAAESRGSKFVYIIEEYASLSYSDKILVTKESVTLFSQPNDRSEKKYTTESGLPVRIIALGDKIKTNNIPNRWLHIGIKQDDGTEVFGWCLGSDLTPLQWEFPYVHSDAEVLFYPDMPLSDTISYITYEGSPLKINDSTEPVYLRAGTPVRVTDSAEGYEKWDSAWFNMIEIELTQNNTTLRGTISSRFVSNYHISEDIDNDGIKEIIAFTTMDSDVYAVTYIKPGLDNILCRCADSEQSKALLPLGNISQWSFRTRENIFPTEPILSKTINGITEQYLLEQTGLQVFKE